MNVFSSKLSSHNRKSTIQNRKWLGFSVIVFVLLVIGAVASAQQPGKIFRIGFLDNSAGSGSAALVDAFRQELRRLGWIEEKNITMEYRFAELKPERTPEIAADLVRKGVDRIVVAGVQAAAAAKKATTTIPIVITSAGDPVRSGFDWESGTAGGQYHRKLKFKSRAKYKETTPQASRAVLQATSTVPIVITGFDPVRIGLAKSLAQPGGNLTGLSSNAGSGMMGKRLELLKEAFPNVKIVGLLTTPTSETRESTLDLTKTVAKALGLQIQHHDIKDGPDIDRSFEPLKKLRVDALHMPAGAITTLNSKRLIALAAKLGVPAIYQTPILVEKGGLMSYGVNFGDLYRRAAGYVDKILKGAKPADLPVEQPTKFELVINLKTAKQIGLTISPNVLARADRVIR